jgi:hypothetical protein
MHRVIDFVFRWDTKARVFSVITMFAMGAVLYGALPSGTQIATVGVVALVLLGLARASMAASSMGMGKRWH